MRTARLLLVDDNPDNLGFLTVLLAEKYVVSGHGCAAEAMQALETVEPDVVVLDIAMTPVDGVECLASIRATPGYSEIPAIALTAFARDVERQEFLRAGFQAVVTKPIIDHHELVAVIDRLLESHRLTPPRRDGMIVHSGYGRTTAA